MRMRLACIFLLPLAHFLISTQSFGQAVEKVSAAMMGGVVQISYVLQGDHANEAFYIDVHMISRDSTVRKLNKLTGDVGYFVVPGNKIVKWDYQKELVHFVGEVQFRVTATTVFTFEDEKPVLRRAKTRQIKWLHSNSAPVTGLSIIDKKGNKTAISSDSITNSMQWTIPASHKTGQFRFEADTDTGSIQSGLFYVKRRIPNGVKALPAILLPVGWCIKTFSRHCLNQRQLMNFL